jgi:hypothetical protein
VKIQTLIHCLRTVSNGDSHALSYESREYLVEHGYITPDRDCRLTTKGEMKLAEAAAPGGER